MSPKKDTEVQGCMYVVVVASMGPQKAVVQNTTEQVIMPVFASADLVASVLCAVKVNERNFRFIGLPGEGARVYRVSTDRAMLDADLNTLLYSKVPDFGVHQGHSWKIMDEVIAPKWVVAYHDKDAQVEVAQVLETEYSRTMR